MPVSNLQDLDVRIRLLAGARVTSDLPKKNFTSSVLHGEAFLVRFARSESDQSRPLWLMSGSVEWTSCQLLNERLPVEIQLEPGPLLPNPLPSIVQTPTRSGVDGLVGRRFCWG